MGVCSTLDKKKRRKNINETKKPTNNNNNEYKTNDKSNNKKKIKNTTNNYKNNNKKNNNDNNKITNIKNNNNNISPEDNNNNSQDFSKLNEFMNDYEIQDSFFDETCKNDLVYIGLKKIEKKELTEEFRKISKSFQNNNLKKGNLNLKLDKNIIQRIIESEDSRNVYKNKIIDEINNIKSDRNKNKIDHLTILLFGRKEIGKTTLIQYMLGLRDDEIKEIQENNINENFVPYENNKLTYLKFIEFKGIGYEQNNDPETIGTQTEKFINKRYKNNNYNDFIHCIWYCVSDTRFEETEDDVFIKLKEVYPDNIMPIIVVYTKTIDKSLANRMGKFITKNRVDVDFVKVLAKENVLPNNKGIIPAFGKEELLEVTLKKCTEALSGKMSNLMIEIMSNDIKENLLNTNKTNEDFIKNDIMDNFISQYKNVKEDYELLNYLVDILGRRLKKFYDKENILNKSLNILIDSKIFENINNFISYYKTETKKVIKSIIKEKAKIFIDYQVIEEKRKSMNINIENKRDLNGFKKTSKIFLKKNFYYISQKFLINYIIRNFCSNYFKEYRKQFDSFIKNDLLILNNNQDIKNLLIDCFSYKLEDFAHIINVPFDNKNRIEINEASLNDLPNRKQVNDETLSINKEINTNSFDLNNNNESDNEEKKENKNNDFDYNEENWFPLVHKNLKYIDNNLINLLNNFVQKIEYQDFYFNQKSTDQIFEKLKEYIKTDLTLFFNSKKKYFINNLDKGYNKNQLTSNSIPISKILDKEGATLNYKEKIKNEFNRLKQKTNFANIDYISIIIVGKSGVGKSTLINSILQLEGEEKAKTGEGKIQTVKEKPYKNKKVPFISIIDTRGIELNKEFGPKEILSKTLEIINNQKNNEENTYNDYVQCIWYCVSNNGIDPEEIEIIKGLKKGQDVLPLIVVYTNSKNQELVNKMEKEIKNNFPNIPFIPTLAKPIENIIDSFGLDVLLKKTFEVCREAVKGDIFNTIKNKTSEEINNIFTKRNRNIKNEVNKEMIYNYINNYNTVKFDKNQINNYINQLLEIIFVGYMKNTLNEKRQLKNQSINDLKNSESISKPLEYFINFYINNTKEFINPILNEKAINYLDVQAKKEKYEFHKNMNMENKNNKDNFINIIETFLNSNFYFISEKYIIYRLITDVRESLSEKVESQFNKIVLDFLSTNDANDWSKDIYYRKMEDLIKILNDFLRNDGYKGDNYKCKKDGYRYNNKIKILNTNNNNIDKIYDCPPGPYPDWNN